MHKVSRETYNRRGMSNMQLNDGPHGAWAGACRTSSGSDPYPDQYDGGRGGGYPKLFPSDGGPSEEVRYGRLKVFANHFVKRKNIIFERAKFNKRTQEVGEVVDDFIMDLYCLAKHCNYGTLHDELIRDRIVVGLRNVAHLEKLQFDADLTLDKAVKMARENEAIKHQKTLLRSDFQENKAAIPDKSQTKPEQLDSCTCPGRGHSIPERSQGRLPHPDNHRSLIHALGVGGPLSIVDSNSQPKVQSVMLLARQGILKRCVVAARMLGLSSPPKTINPFWVLYNSRRVATPGPSL